MAQPGSVAATSPARATTSEASAARAAGAPRGRPDAALPNGILAGIVNNYGPGAVTIDLPLQGDAPPTEGGYWNPDANFDYAPVADVVKCLYLCEPRDELFAFFTEGATFEDPAGKLPPLQAFKGLAELFAPSTVTRWQITDVTRQRIKIEVDMSYSDRTRHLPNVPFRTVLTVSLSPDGRIAGILDEWAGSPLMFSKDGFLGKLAEARRGITGAMQKAFVDLSGGKSVQSTTPAEPGAGSGTRGGASAPSPFRSGRNPAAERIHLHSSASMMERASSSAGKGGIAVGSTSAGTDAFGGAGTAARA